MTLTELEKAYIAGIFDGEGTIGFYGGKSQDFSLRLKLGNTNLEVVEWIQQHCGGWITSRVLKVSKKTFWEWSIKRRADVVDILKAIQPYLIVKRTQADLLVDFLENEGVLPRRGAPEKRSSMLRDRETVINELKRLKTVQTSVVH